MEVGSVASSELTTPAGIAAFGYKCWEIIDLSNGLPIDDHGDGIRHFDSLADANSWAEDAGVQEKGAGVEPREVDAPCWLVTAICGWVLDDELPMQMHHATAEEALRAALDSDMTIASGGLICSPDCDDCKSGTSPDPSAGDA